MDPQGTRQIDIDPILVAALKSSASWTGAAAQTAARKIADETFRIDWDDGAGEAWIRLISGGEVKAYISVEVPLMLAVEGVGTGKDVDPSLQVIIMQDVEQPVLAASTEVLHQIFGKSDRLSRLDITSFSGNDLWYATV
jgi:hypothetical protein